MNSNTKSILSRQSIEAIVKKHFGPGAAVEHIEEVTEGWFNAIYLLSLGGEAEGPHREVVLKTGVEDGKYVLAYEKNLMKAELRVYDLLRDTIVPLPQILARDSTRSLVDCDYFLMERLRGDTWMRLEDRISAENRERLIGELARYTAAISGVRGDYFGYIREDASFHYPDWRSAFRGMVDLQMRDGRAGGVDLPYDAVLEAFEPLWGLLDEIREPRLVNFDMWAKNILLIERDGEYVIDGIIDHERAFFGDPYAEFLSSATICGPVEQCQTFMEGYSQVSGRPFTYTREDRLRLHMYKIYLSLLMGVEVYRYDEEDTRRMLALCAGRIGEDIAALRRLQAR